MIKKTILVVEDEKDVRENICQLLVEEGYEVIEASDGISGYEAAKKHFPDLIISDIQMPEKTGYGLLDLLQSEDDTKIIPFIFLTAKTELENTRLGMKKGADDYIYKPFKAKDLLDSIRTRLNKKANYEKPISDLQEQIFKKISHELRTPLVPIIGYSDIALDINDMEEIKHMVQNIKSAGLELTEKINKFLLHKDLISIWSSRELMEELANYTSVVYPDKIKQRLNEILNIHERINDAEISLEPAQLKVKSEFLDIILNELLDNAVKYSEKGDSIVITGIAQAGLYHINVKDGGRGMTSSEIKSLKAFRKFGVNHMVESGFGLGLSITQKIVELCKGEFEISSEPLGGTNVAVGLPLV